MRVQVLQHVAFEGLGSMEAWFVRRGADIQYTRFFESSDLPDPRDADMVVAMGGPMSVNDEHRYPWLRDEKRFVREFIRSGRPILGVCLGAQIVAGSLGAKVYPGRHAEIGWFPIQSSGSNGGVFRFPEDVTVFHWHGETFDLPAGAIRLASSAACENQAFQIGGNVIGLQFHLEVTPDTCRRLIDNCRNELTDGAYVQAESALRNTPRSAYASVNALMDHVLSYLVDRAQ